MRGQHKQLGSVHGTNLEQQQHDMLERGAVSQSMLLESTLFEQDRKRYYTCGINHGLLCMQEKSAEYTLPRCTHMCRIALDTAATFLKECSLKPQFATFLCDDNSDTVMKKDVEYRDEFRKKGFKKPRISKAAKDKNDGIALWLAKHYQFLKVAGMVSAWEHADGDVPKDLCPPQYEENPFYLVRPLRFRHLIHMADIVDPVPLRDPEYKGQ